VSATTDPAPYRDPEPLPSGTVTFAFTDIEESTRRWERNRSVMEDAIRRHDALVRTAIARHRGYVFKALGDAFCAAFARPADAVAAMLDAQRSLATEDFSALDGLPVRAAIHTGAAVEREGDYFGPVVNRVARLLAIGHGGQVLVSGATAAIVEGDLPSQTSLRGLGEHRLKDLAQPEQVFQLHAPGLVTGFPPLRSLNAFATNLPLELTSFVGREKDVAEIESLIREHRFVSLVGSGGVGKTRAALHVAANLFDDSSDGVWFIELAPLASGEYLPSAVAQVLSIALPADGDPLEELVLALKGKNALLLFDNCEHVVAPAARVIAAILSGCPKIKVLASSRQCLEIAGEYTYRLPSLDLPQEDALQSLRASDAQQFASVALFAERARAADERFMLTDDNAAVIAEICRRLDGIPLAIELAASRTTVLSPRQISERLTERFRLLSQTGSNRLPRQQTLRALIDWSFDLLDASECTVFRRLSVFAGGWTVQAASAVCADADIDEWQVFELLSALVSKSLVAVEADGDDRRYRMLNSIREYSRERVTDTKEAGEIAAQHARYYSDLVLGLASLVAHLEDVQWQRRLARELDNLRAALDWAVFRGNDVEAGLRLLAHLEWPELLTTPQEAIAWFDAAARLTDASGDATAKARALRQLVRLEWLVGRPIAHREKTAIGALTAARACADPDEIAQSLANLGSVYRDAGRFDDAEPLFSEAYDRAETLSPIACNAVLRNWAVTNLQRGDLSMARRRFTEVAERERPGSEAHASALLNIGELEFAAGNVEAARTAARNARTAFAQLNAAPLGLAVCNLAAYALAIDQLDEARELLREALQLLKRSGARWMITALEHHAVLAGLVGDHERAATLLGFTNAHYADNDTRQTTERHGYDRLTRLLTQVYDQEEFERRLSAGARLRDEQALEYAAAISQPTPRKE
jgi:predicted ATPase/class 3 adenylate cyclase